MPISAVLQYVSPAAPPESTFCRLAVPAAVHASTTQVGCTQRKMRQLCPPSRCIKWFHMGSSRDASIDIAATSPTVAPVSSPPPPGKVVPLLAWCIASSSLPWADCIGLQLVVASPASILSCTCSLLNSPESISDPTAATAPEGIGAAVTSSSGLLGAVRPDCNMKTTGMTTTMPTGSTDNTRSVLLMGGLLQTEEQTQLQLQQLTSTQHQHQELCELCS